MGQQIEGRAHSFSACDETTGRESEISTKGKSAGRRARGLFEVSGKRKQGPAGVTDADWGSASSFGADATLWAELVNPRDRQCGSLQGQAEYGHLSYARPAPS